MARERMVTRTIISINATVKAYNLDTDAIENVTVVLTGDIPSDIPGHLERTFSKTHPTHRFIKVVDVVSNEQLYAMTEVDFLKYAKPIEKGATKVPKA